MKKNLTSLLLILSIVFINKPLEAQWNQITLPDTAPTSFMIMHDNDFFLAEPSGLYRSEDGGTNWSKVIDEEIFDLANFDGKLIGKIKTYSYNNGETSANFLFHESEDNGLTWTAIESLMDRSSLIIQNDIIIEYENAQTLENSDFFTNNGHLRISNDKGINFQEIPLPENRYVQRPIINYHDGRLIITLVDFDPFSQETYMYLSNDLGQNWEEIAEAQRIFDIKSLEDDIYSLILDSLSSQIVYYSRDAGSTWNLQTHETDEAGSIDAFARTRLMINSEYIAYNTTSGIVYSEDRESIWSPLETPKSHILYYDSEGISFVKTINKPEFTKFSINSKSLEDIQISGVSSSSFGGIAVLEKTCVDVGDSLLITLNGEEVFINKNTNELIEIPGSNSVNDIVYHKDSLFGLSSNQIVKYDPGSEQWLNTRFIYNTRLNPSGNFIGFYKLASTNDNLYAGAASFPSQFWSFQTAIENQDTLAISIATAVQGSFINPFIYLEDPKKSDGITIWKPLINYFISTDGIEFSILNSLGRFLFPSGDDLISYDNDFIYRSIDLGVTWTGNEYAKPFTQINGSMIDLNNRLFASTDRGVYFTEDDGSTWRSTGVGLENYNVNKLFASENESLYALSDGRGLFTIPISELEPRLEIIGVIDDELSFEPNSTISVEFEDLIVESNIVYPDLELILIEGNEYEIEGNEILPNDISVSSFSVATQITDGIDSSNVFMVPIKINNPLSLENLSKHIYPNPSKNSIKISMNEGDSFQFELLNQTGQELKTGQVSFINSEINIEDLRPGIYFIKFINRDHLTTYKFVKL